MTPPRPRSADRAMALRLAAFAALLIALFAGYRFFWSASADALVVYCAHDSIYSEKLLREFERETGIPVSIRFDTEATKSLGLVELLLRERERPRCDVFWNNELLGTLQLADEGLLVPYHGSGHHRIPSAFKDAEGRWAGFAARLRVWIINTNRIEPTDEAVRHATSGNLDRMAIARPLYGTTRTQYTVLWNLMGQERLVAWHRDWRARQIREVSGNATVKDLVAAGVCDLGWTDTDDFFVARDNGKPVEMLPIRVESGGTICIPNTVGIIRGTRRLAAAQKLVDFLLSERSELALASSGSRQIPLGPVTTESLPEDVKRLQGWAAEGVALGQLHDASIECLKWLKSEYLP